MTFTCESFDYSRATSTCFLSQESRDSQPGAYSKHAKSDYYERVCDDDEDDSGGSGMTKHIIGSSMIWFKVA